MILPNMVPEIRCFKSIFRKSCVDFKYKVLSNFLRNNIKTKSTNRNYRKVEFEYLKNHSNSSSFAVLRGFYDFNFPSEAEGNDRVRRYSGSSIKGTFQKNMIYRHVYNARIWILNVKNEHSHDLPEAVQIDGIVWPIFRLIHLRWPVFINIS